MKKQLIALLFRARPPAVALAAPHGAQSGNREYRSGVTKAFRRMARGTFSSTTVWAAILPQYQRYERVANRTWIFPGRAE